MFNQRWKYFAFTCAPLGRSLNPSLSLAHDRGEFSRSTRIGLIASASIKSCAMLAVLAWSTVSIAAGQSATTEIAQQDQTAPAAEHHQTDLTLEPVHPGFPIGPFQITLAA
jgi:hypothetical protein